MTDLIWIAFPGEIYCAINLKWLWLFGLQQEWDKSAVELDGSMPTATPNEMKHICGSDRRKYQGTSSSQSNSFHAWCQQSLQAPTGNTPRYTQLLLRIEGIFITEWKPRGADVMLKNINIKRWLTPRLLQFGRRCWQWSSVSCTARAWGDTQ